MIKVSASASSSDAPLLEAATERPGQPIKIRVQPSLLRRRPQDTRASYQTWRDLHFLVECDTLADVQELRDALIAFFWLVSQRGALETYDRLLPQLQHVVPSSALHVPAPESPDFGNQSLDVVDNLDVDHLT